MPRIPADRLKQTVREVFAAAGCRPPEEERIAHYLVESNLVGHDSHGVIRVASYVAWLRDGKVLANQKPTVVMETDTLAVLDGNFGFGQTIGEAAVKRGIDKARTRGVSVIALRNCGHLGRIGDWPTLAADANLVSLHFVNTSGAGNLVAPFGGIDRRLSANPIAAGVPRVGTWPLVVDISTSAIAEGKIRVALHRGDRVPAGSIIDPEGNPTDDPRVFYGPPPGAILPFGAHKGYALGMLAEVLGGALTGGGCTRPGVTRLSNGMLSIYLDPARFVDNDGFQNEVRTYIEFVKGARTVTADGKILIPGEIEALNRQRRLAEGIELDETTWRQLTETCQTLGVSPPVAAG
ncbi:MAG TPA: malate/lactate/ureidoglycolate dehydrogenase [Pirellulales bacterium]|nr:malate/lactate/ureidoglycolate dehydrogenase [Pirellulales bacterium]